MTWIQFNKFPDPLLLLSSPLVWTLAVVLLTILARWAYRYQRWCNALNRLPGPPAAWPLVGHASYFIRPGYTISECLLMALPVIGAEFARDHGYFHLAFGPVHVAVIAHPEAAEKIFGSSTAHNPKSAEYRYLHRWFGTGLLTSTGPKWRSRRRLLTPAFHFDILRDFLPIMNEEADHFVGRLMNMWTKDQATGDNGDQKRPLRIDILPEITALTLDIISETAMGVRVGAQENPNSAYYQAILTMSKIPIGRAYSPIHFVDWIHYNLTPMGRTEVAALAAIHEFEDSVILNRRDEMIKRNLQDQNENLTAPSVRSAKRRLAFLDIVLQEHLRDPTHFTLRDVQEETETFMFEGHDTTAMSLVWTLLALGAEEEIQQRVIDEVDLVLSSEGTDGGPITPAMLSDLTYLEAVIKESLRLHPSVPIIGREATEDIHLGSGHVIPRGTSTFVSIINIHLDDRLYPDPHKFDPSRFLANEKRHPYAYVPFSAGPRNCIGQRFALMEEKIIIASILRRFRLRSITREAEVRAAIELVYRPHDPIVIEFIPRD